MLKHEKQWGFLVWIIVLLLPLFILSGCGGGGGGGSAPATPAPPTATLSSIAVSPANASFGQKATQQFTATGTYSDGTTKDLTGEAAWVSSNPAVATITTASLPTSSLFGLATTIASGTTTITATLGDIMGSTTLTVIPTQFNVGGDSYGIAIDASGNVWVTVNTTLTAGSVVELTASGAYKNGTLANSSFTVGAAPYGIAIDASGDVWVTNNRSNNVTELTGTGVYIGTFTVGASPFGIAIDASGNVWVTNNVSNSVTELTGTGAYIGSFTVGAYPFGIAIDAAGNVWVADNNVGNSSGTGYVTELSPSGTYKNGTLANSSFFVGTGANPRGVAIDTAGDVWVADYDSGYVTELNSSGAYKNGTLVNSSYLIGVNFYGFGPTNIVVDASGTVWVADTSIGYVAELNSSGAFKNGTVFNSTFPSIGVNAIDASGNMWATGTSVFKQINSGATGPQYFPYSGPQWPSGL